MKEVESRLEAAGSEHDHKAVKLLLAEVREAARGRAEMELRIENHEHTAHADQTQTVDSDRPWQPAGRRLCDVERAHIQRIFAETGENISMSARILDIDRSTLYSKLKRYGLK